MTVQQIADVAARHATLIADETLRACAVWSYENGIPVSIPKERLINTVMRRVERVIVIDEDEHALDEGNCHRYPPQCQWDGDGMVVLWPVVDWADWCGEHQMKE